MKEIDDKVKNTPNGQEVRHENEEKSQIIDDLIKEQEKHQEKIRELKKKDKDMSRMKIV